MPKLKRLALGQRTVSNTADALSDIEGTRLKATTCSIFVDKDGKAQEICQVDDVLNTNLLIQPLAEQHLSMASDTEPIINAVTSKQPIPDDPVSWIAKSAAKEINTVAEKTAVSEKQTVTEKRTTVNEKAAILATKLATVPSKETPSPLPVASLPPQEVVAPAKPQEPSPAPKTIEPVKQETAKETPQQPAQTQPAANTQAAATAGPSPAANNSSSPAPSQTTNASASSNASPQSAAPPATAAPQAQTTTITLAKPPVLTPEQMLEQEMAKLVESEKKLGSDLPTLHELYLKGIIDKESYERSKAAIDVRYAELEKKLKSVNEKTQLEQLKKRITQEIESALTTPQFEEANKQLLAEAAKLDELFNDGIIDKKIYDDKKTLIQQKLNRIKTLESKVASAFDAYVQEFAPKQDHDEADRKLLLDKIDQEIEESLKPKPAPVAEKKVEEITKPLPSLLVKHPKLLTIANKVGLFKTKEDSQEAHTAGGLHEEIQKIETIRKKQNDEFALINTVLLVKRQLLQRLAIDKEMTYSEILSTLPKTAMDSELRERLIAFFNNYLEKQYIGAMSDSDFNQIWTEGNKLLALIQERMKPAVTEQKKK